MASGAIQQLGSQGYNSGSLLTPTLPNFFSMPGLYEGGNSSDVDHNFPIWCPAAQRCAVSELEVCLHIFSRVKTILSELQHVFAYLYDKKNSTR